MTKPVLEIKCNMYKKSKNFKKPFGFRVRYPSGYCESFIIEKNSGVLACDLTKKDRKKAEEIIDKYA